MIRRKQKAPIELPPDPETRTVLDRLDRAVDSMENLYDKYEPLLRELATIKGAPNERHA